MAIKVPGNPFGVDVQVGSTQEMGLQSAKESEFSARKSWEGIGGTFGKALESFQKDIDETITRDNMLSLNEAVDDLLNNEQTGLLRRKGKNALELNNGMTLQEEAENELKRRYDVISKGAHNKAQKSALEKFYYNSLTSVQNKLSNHIVEQQAVARKNQRDRENDFSIKSIMSNDPEAQKSGILIVRKNIEDAAREAGVEPDYSSVLGEIHVLKVTQLINENKTSDAANWIKDHKDEMSAKQYGTAKNLSDKAVRAQENLEIAQKIFEQAKGVGSDALKAVANVASDRQSDVKKNVQSLINNQEAIRNQERKEATRTAWSYVLEAQAHGGQISLPLTLRNALEESNPTALLRIEKYISQVNNGEKIKTDPDVWDRLWDSFTNTPEDFRSLNLDEFRGELSNTDYKYFRRLQDRADKSEATLFMKNVLAQADADKKLKKYKPQIKNAASRIWNEAEENAKGGIDSKKRAELEALVFSEVKDQDSWFGGKSAYWKVVDENAHVAPISAVSEYQWGSEKSAAIEKVNSLGFGVRKEWTKQDANIALAFSKTGSWPKQVVMDTEKWLDEPVKSSVYAGMTNRQAFEEKYKRKLTSNDLFIIQSQYFISNGSKR